ncbi:mannose-1-phosphate guanylyltransferase/mannose-6-phosphate isomerase [Vibrio wakamikoensis]|uniref:mannose-1-phosphate guanylyltransferase/mannose-6-phosphate isomerase n=1 Tax=Vibrio wakamikoensis TaxID=2910251 RepID=UPI003D1D541A
MIKPVIMSGGNGSRLWPLSRKKHPKQFLSLIGEQTMLQETITRLQGLDIDTPSVICNEGHRFIVAEQLREISCEGANIILEPEGRNTAPAITLAALKVLEQKQDPILLVLAADHVIKNTAKFHKAIEAAASCANNGHLVTFGIQPDRAETGYGYIKASEDIAGTQCYRVAKFVEKPSKEIAQQYVESGHYYWNSGMFMFKASTFIQELEKHRPDILLACQKALVDTTEEVDFIRLKNDAFLHCPAESVDYAIMEKTEHAAMVPLDAQWSDVGAWDSIWECQARDSNGNSLRGDTHTIDVSNSIIDARDKMVAAIGVDNLIIVDTSDAVLVAHKDKAQDVKKIVDKLSKDGRREATQHRTIYRPWGKIDLLMKGERYKTKKVTIYPGQRLSLQKHFHRAEHWVVVQGTANVRCENKTLVVTENQSTYIPIGAEHSLENPGQIALVMIEVQTGSYIDQSDIVRLEDLYGFEKDYL